MTTNVYFDETLLAVRKFVKYQFFSENKVHFNEDEYCRFPHID